MKYKSMSGAIVGIIGGGIEIFTALVIFSTAMYSFNRGDLGTVVLRNLAGSLVMLAGGILSLVGGILALKNSTNGGILQIIGGVLDFASGFISAEYFMYAIVAANIVSSILSFMVKEPVVKENPNGGIAGKNENSENSDEKK